MTSVLRSVACAALAIALGLGIGSAIGWHSAAAITVEDSTGNPDVVAPLTDPDDGNGDTSSQGGGFTIIAPDQSGNGLTFGSPTMPTDTSDQSQ